MIAIAALGSILGGSTVAYATESHAPRAAADARTYDWDPIDKEYKLNGTYPCEVAFE
ncbi:hypothetical protein [Streptomyces sp. NPDC093568]|uniref:hypothetical protein n=1 Tax=Streptomyces sp. NPDC093568 TaxID=3366041 RepID=UPI0037F99691